MLTRTLSGREYFGRVYGLAGGYYINFRIGQRGLKEKRVLSRSIKGLIVWGSLGLLGFVFLLNSRLNLKHWGSFAFMTDNWFYLLLDFLCVGIVIFLLLRPDRSYLIYGAPEESFMTAVMVALHDLNQPYCEISEKKLQLINENAVLQINFSNTIHFIKMKPDRPGQPVKRIAAGVEKYYQDNPDKMDLQIFN